MTPVTRRDWRDPAAWEGRAWQGTDPWTRSRPPASAQALEREHEKAKQIDWQIRIASVRLYGERLDQYRRLRRLGVKCPPPTHYSETLDYKQACRRLAAPPPQAAARAATPPHDPTCPGLYRRPFGHVIAVY